MFKKILAAVVCAGLLCIGLAGCGGSKNACVGNWQITTGDNGLKNMISDDELKPLEDMGFQLKDICVISIRDNGTATGFLSGTEYKMDWEEEDSSSIVCKGKDTKDNDYVLHAKVENDRLYISSDEWSAAFEKSDRDADKMVSAYNEAYGEKVSLFDEIYKELPDGAKDAVDIAGEFIFSDTTQEYVYDYTTSIKETYDSLSKPVKAIVDLAITAYADTFKDCLAD